MNYKNKYYVYKKKFLKEQKKLFNNTYSSEDISNLINYKNY